MPKLKTNLRLVTGFFTLLLGSCTLNAHAQTATRALPSPKPLASILPVKEKPVMPTPISTRLKSFSKPSDAELKKTLSEIQYTVTQKEGTERAFKNEYADNHQAGIYVDIVSGEPLFSSLDKFDSGTGWPSFSRPIDEKYIVRREDRRLFFSKRVEIRSKIGDSHLGHVFDDGPAPTGLRYCMNSAAMKFVPAERLEQEGYGEYAGIFGNKKKGEAIMPTTQEIALLAGGCFWGVEEIIRKIPGVIETEVGYTGGLTPNVTYEQVKTGQTGHAESVRITFDPARLSYEELLRWFFRLHDPTTANRQGNDVGTQYRSAIFFNTPQQRESAERVKREVDASGKWKKPLVTEIVPAEKFHPGEDYHQDYLKKNPGGYTCHYLRD